MPSSGGPAPRRTWPRWAVNDPRYTREGTLIVVPCCRFHNENCTDLEEACCMACPFHNGRGPDGEA